MLTIKKPFAIGLISLSLFISGCDIPEHSEKIKQLEADNVQIKKDLAEIKQQLTAVEETVSEQNTIPFNDVTSEVPNADMIEDLAKLGIFKDLGQAFEPYKPLTRGEYLIWLYRAYNAQHPPEKQLKLYPQTKLPYTDIATDHPCYKYAQAFTAAGFVVGYDNKTFKPDAPITREEMIAIKYPVDGRDEIFTNDNPTAFIDDKSIDKRYHKAVRFDEIFAGNKPRGNNTERAFGQLKTFNPKEPVLRYQAAGSIWQTHTRGQYTAAKALETKETTK